MTLRGIAIAGPLVICLGIGFTTGGDAESDRSSFLTINGGFEEESPRKDEPSGWSATRVPRTREHVVFAWDGEMAHEGTRSVSISISRSHPPDEIHYSWNQRVSGWKTGTTYELSGWLKTENLEKPGAIVVPRATAAMVVLAGIAAPDNNGGKIWIDEITIERKPE